MQLIPILFRNSPKAILKIRMVYTVELLHIASRYNDFAGLYYAKNFLMPLSVRTLLSRFFLPFCKWMERKSPGRWPHLRRILIIRKNLISKYFVEPVNIFPKV